VRWRRPLRPDIDVCVRSTVLETRVSNSRLGAGFVKLRFELIDSNGAAIAEMVPTIMFGRCAPGEAA
jgi:acyl dehydratase